MTLSPFPCHLSRRLARPPHTACTCPAPPCLELPPATQRPAVRVRRARPLTASRRRRPTTTPVQTEKALLNCFFPPLSRAGTLLRGAKVWSESNGTCGAAEAVPLPSLGAVYREKRTYDHPLVAKLPPLTRHIQGGGVFFVFFFLVRLFEGHAAPSEPKRPVSASTDP